MDYKIFKLSFLNGVHFGEGTLDDTAYTFMADTMFSALCLESLKSGKEQLEELVSKTKSGDLSFSDAFPYIKGTYYIPKPNIRIESNNEGDSVLKKKYKNTQYIDSSLISRFVAGDYPEEKLGKLSNLGIKEKRTLVSIRGQEKTEPYRIGVYRYRENAGLYIIVGYSSDDVLNFVADIMDSLAESGIGGKRSSGMGRFTYQIVDMPGYFSGRIDKTTGRNMLLSAALPREEEIEETMINSNYTLIKRSGFVFSENYSDELRKKDDLFVFKAGSCFEKIFQGDIYDVSRGGNHPVYRYARPMFMRV